MSRALFVVLALASGCTRANTEEVPYLDGAVKVSATGTRPRSSVSLDRGGALDPASAAMEVMVRDADVKLHRGANGHAILDDLQLYLDDVDLPPSPDLPNGLALRDVSLALDAPLPADVAMAEPDTLVLQVETPLEVRSSMVLSDGTLYPLGAVPTEPGQLTVRVTLDGEKATATVDAAPPATCWSVSLGNQQLLSANHCALFVESIAKVEAL